MSNTDAPHDNDNRPAVVGPVQRQVRPGALWDAGRCKELEKLQDLLHEVSAINKGSNCLGRIANCIALAEMLTKFDLDSGRSSFEQFLRDRAIEDRFGPLA